jgi:hypothetical protein
MIFLIAVKISDNQKNCLFQLISAYLAMKERQFPNRGNYPKQAPVSAKKGHSNALSGMHEIPHMLI